MSSRASSFDALFVSYEDEDMPPSSTPTVLAPVSSRAHLIKICPPPPVPTFDDAHLEPFQFEPRLPPSSIPRPIEQIKASIAAKALRPAAAPTVKVDMNTAFGDAEAERAELVRIWRGRRVA